MQKSLSAFLFSAGIDECFKETAVTFCRSEVFRMPLDTQNERMRRIFKRFDNAIFTDSRNPHSFSGFGNRLMMETVDRYTVFSDYPMQQSSLLDFH